MKKIAVIGAGFSGLMAAVHLADEHRSLQISLIGSEPDFAKGVAYSVKNDAFLLNVPAAVMGAFPDKPDDFYHWLVRNNLPYNQNDFVPRRFYGEYLNSLLQLAKSRAGQNFIENTENSNQHSKKSSSKTRNCL